MTHLQNASVSEYKQKIQQEIPSNASVDADTLRLKVCGNVGDIHDFNQAIEELLARRTIYQTEIILIKDDAEMKFTAYYKGRSASRTGRSYKTDEFHYELTIIAQSPQPVRGSAVQTPDSIETYNQLSERIKAEIHRAFLVQSQDTHSLMRRRGCTYEIHEKRKSDS